MTSQTVEPQIHPWSFRFTPGAPDPPLHLWSLRSTPGGSDLPLEHLSLESQLYHWSFKSSLEPLILIGRAPGGTVSSVAHTDPRWYGIRGCWGLPSNVEALLGMFISSRTHILMSSYLHSLLQLRPPSQDLRLWFPSSSSFFCICFDGCVLRVQVP